MKESILSIILALIASAAAILAFVQFLITRRDQKKGELAQILKDNKEMKQAIQDVKMDNCRMQLMMLIRISPKSAADILPLAFHYFVELKGDQFLTNLFSDWLKSQEINKPIWFKGEHQ